MSGALILTLGCDGACDGVASGAEGSTSDSSGDGNGDERLDLATALVVEAQVGLALQGDGEWTESQHAAGGLGPTDILATHLDNDGRPDLVIAIGGLDNEGEAVVALRAAAGGGFEIGAPISVGPTPEQPVAGDYDADGHMDVAILVPGTSQVGILLGDGAGALAPPVMLQAGAGAGALATGDLNEDGVPDLVTADTSANQVTVFLSLH